MGSGSARETSAAVGTNGARYRVAKGLAALLMPIGRIKGHERNARRRTPRNIDAIRASFERFGQQRPLLVFRFPGQAIPTVISGNGGFMVAGQMGWTHVAATEFEGTAREAEAYAVADNRTGELSEWESDVLTVAAEAMRADETLRDLYGKLRLDQIVSAIAGDEASKPEVPFTTELLEEHNYLVFTFVNELDWQVAAQAFGIGSAHSLKSRPGFQQIGIGRVLDGAKTLLPMVKAKASGPGRVRTRARKGPSIKSAVGAQDGRIAGADL